MASYRDLTGKYPSVYNDFELPGEIVKAKDNFDFRCDDDDSCDGFCPECNLMIKCETYIELKDEWESFYM